MARNYNERRDTFMLKLKEIHKDAYDIKEVVYVNAKTPIILICPVHGAFSIIPSNIVSNKRGCQQCKRGNQKRVVTNLDSFINKANLVHNNRYSYEETNYVKSTSPVTITCKDHGNFSQTPASHISGSTCPSCADIHRFLRLTRSTDSFIKKAQEVHKNIYEYHNTNYIGVKDLVCVTCKDHGDFNIVAGYHLQSYRKSNGCPSCNIYASKGETAISAFLLASGTIFETEKTFSNLVGFHKTLLRFDFYLPEHNTAIEFQGHFHYSSIMGSDLEKQVYYDGLKKEYCENNAINLLCIPYWLYEDVEAILTKAIQK